MSLPNRLLRVIACPVCHGSLEERAEELVCSACGNRYPVVDGVPVLMDDETRTSLEDTSARYAHDYGDDEQVPLFRRIYEAAYPSVDMRYIGATGPYKHGSKRLNGFLADFGPEDDVVDIGGGSRDLGPSVVNVEIGIFPNVDVVGSAFRLPFPNDSVDGVVIQMVLEHLPDPGRAADEIHRILKPGGRVYCDVPFLFHQHGDPDFFRFTVQGIEAVFDKFEPVDAGVCVGPASNLRLLLIEYFSEALSLGQRHLRYGLSLALAWLTWPLEAMDRLVDPNRFRGMATANYFIGRK